MGTLLYRAQTLITGLEMFMFMPEKLYSRDAKLSVELMAEFQIKFEAKTLPLKFLKTDRWVSFFIRLRLLVLGPRCLCLCPRKLFFRDAKLSVELMAEFQIKFETKKFPLKFLKTDKWVSFFIRLRLLLLGPRCLCLCPRNYILEMPKSQ
jgi:competence CoiA-like predicted nuclease